MQGFHTKHNLKRQLFTNILHYKNLILNFSLMSSVQVKLHLKIGLYPYIYISLLSPFNFFFLLPPQILNNIKKWSLE